MDLGSHLVSQDKIQAEQLDKALLLQKESDLSLPKLLVQLEYISERDIAEVMSSYFDIEFATENELSAVNDLPKSISPDFLRKYCVLPLSEKDGEHTIAVSDPTDTHVLTSLELSLSSEIVFKLSTESLIQSNLNRLCDTADLSDLRQSDSTADNQADIEHLRDMASDAPVVRSVNRILNHALEHQASDVHFEPSQDGLVVRTRIDGVLNKLEIIKGETTQGILSRIKVISGLDIAENRMPQDGRIKLRLSGKDIDVRVSTLPSMYGESIVLRLLEQSGLKLDFNNLSFESSIVSQIKTLVSRPNGIFLVTGPTGSGKSTTLYTALNHLNTTSVKILTVEDPVEYRLPGITQIQVQSSIDLSFSRVLRSALRHDPDIIMVGEMRDTETAKIAIQAALTGHSVLSTLHTNDASSAITRLLDMHIDNYLIASTVNGVLAQRLVRKLCDKCKTHAQLPPTVEELLKNRKIIASPPTDSIFAATGCQHCDHTGYKGRTVIYELITINDDIRHAITNKPTAASIRNLAIEQGMDSIELSGYRKVLKGETSVEEVQRAVQISQELII